MARTAPAPVPAGENDRCLHGLSRGSLQPPFGPFFPDIAGPSRSHRSARAVRILGTMQY